MNNKMELNKKVEIKVLHINNPTDFLFRTVDDTKKLEEDLKKYLENSEIDLDYVPKKGDVVIVKMDDPPLIVRVTKLAPNEDEYVYVSRLEKNDHRMYSYRDVIKITDQSLIDNAKNTLLLGAIQDACPTDFSFPSGIRQKIRCRTWSERAINVFTGIIDRASTVYFEPMQIENCRFFGNLLYANNILDALVVTELANRSNDSIDESTIRQPKFTSTPKSILCGNIDDLDDIKCINGTILSGTSSGVSANETKEISHERETNGIGSVHNNSPHQESNVGSENAVDFADNPQSRSASDNLQIPSDHETKHHSENCTSNASVDFCDNVSKIQLENGSKSETKDESESTLKNYSANSSTYCSISGGSMVDSDEPVAKMVTEHHNIIDKSDVTSTDSNTSFKTSKSNSNDVEERPIDKPNNKSADADQYFYATLHHARSLSIISERTEIDKDTKSDIDADSYTTSIFSYLNENPDTEEEPEQYEYKFEDSEQRDRDTKIRLRKETFDNLLKYATLPAEQPYVNSLNGQTEEISPATEPYFYTELDELIRSKEVYPIQKRIWPYLTNRSIAMIGHTEFYPHLLYLPAICNSIEKNKHNKKDGPKVVIFASTIQQASNIRKLCECYLNNTDLVYWDVGAFSNKTNGLINEPRFQKCHIFITLTRCFNDIGNFFEIFCDTRKTVIINDFETMPEHNRMFVKNWVNTQLRKCPHRFNHYMQLLVTSNYFVEELKGIIEMISKSVIFTHSGFDLFYFTSGKNGIRTTEIEFPRDYDPISYLELKLHPKRNVIVCTNEKDADELSSNLKRCEINSVVNQKPTNVSTSTVLICTDNMLKEMNIEKGVHIIHYDLPDNFDTFSFRYLTLQANLKYQVNQQPDTETLSSLIMLKQENQPAEFLLLLLARQYPLQMEDNNLTDKFRQMHTDAPLCIDLVNSFRNIGHLLECKNRHSFNSQERLTVESIKYKIKILDVFSPAWFAVRLIQSRKGPTKWNDCHSAKLFDDFNAELKEFYSKSFEPIKDVANINVESNYVFRNRGDFFRCKLLGKNIEGHAEKIRIKLIDHGKCSTTDISNLGHLHECHTGFPMQSIDLCLLKIAPWHRNGWNSHDVIDVDNLLSCRNPSEKFGNTIFELEVQCQIQNELLLSFDEMIATNSIDHNQTNSYNEFIIQRGLAYNTKDGLRDLFLHANKMNVLTTEQLDRLRPYLD